MSSTQASDQRIAFLCMLSPSPWVYRGVRMGVGACVGVCLCGWVPVWVCACVGVCLYGWVPVWGVSVWVGACVGGCLCGCVCVCVCVPPSGRARAPTRFRVNFTVSILLYFYVQRSSLTVICKCNLLHKFATTVKSRPR